MTTSQLTRRHLLACAGIAVALPTLDAEPAAQQAAFPKDAEEGLGRLRDGNQRFVAGQTRYAHESAEWRKQLVGGQKPFATILGCSDSRAPIELVFDQGFGDLFVIRVAGNVVAPDVVGSVEYAVEHLATSLIVVVGHEGCGAVTAAVEALDHPTKELPGVKHLVELIKPGLPQALPDDTPEQRISAAVEANVRWSIQQLAQLPEAKKALDSKLITLVGAVYELTTGRVRVLSG